MKEKKTKEIRLNTENLEVRNDEQNNKMIIEGYPIVFNQEAYLDCGVPEWSFYEKIDSRAFENADMSDVALKYNHNDNFLILARTRNESLKLTIDEHGIFMHAELIDTTQNRDVYKMVESGLLNEGSFAFTVTGETETVDADGIVHRTITGIGKLFDVAICPNGAYGNLTEIYARSYELLESTKAKAEAEKRREILRLKNRNKIKLMEERKWN